MNAEEMREGAKLYNKRAAKRKENLKPVPLKAWNPVIPEQVGEILALLKDDAKVSHHGGTNVKIGDRIFLMKHLKAAQQIKKIIAAERRKEFERTGA